MEAYGKRNALKNGNLIYSVNTSEIFASSASENLLRVLFIKMFIVKALQFWK